MSKTIIKSETFDDRYRDLPSEIQQTAEKQIHRFIEDERHPSLHTKKVGKVYSFWLNVSYRIVFRRAASETVEFIFVGNHGEYDRFIKKFQ